ncbi:MAG TPA: hypothetical protein VEU09_07795 [Candidatus Binatia bacterium]|nr:hypothetical protein [Candidatus Binatia bacterium]
MPRRARGPAVAASLAVLCLFLPGPARAAHKPVVPAGTKPPVVAPVPPPPPADRDSYYHQLLGNLSINAPSDTLGSAEYESGQHLFEAGLFDSAATLFQRFAVHYPRNLLLNDAIEHVLLIRETREPGDEALKLYARTLALRSQGLADSAAAAARSGLERFPNARIRYHWEFLLADLNRERGNHSEAVRFALLVADSTSKSRLAPYALKLAGDETLAMGDGPARALRLYQALLERYPASPLAPPVRAQVMELRKKLQL